MEWRNIFPEIPAFKFPSDWEVKIVPPNLPSKYETTQATAHFLVRVENDVWLSVILDLKEVFSSFGGQPYWELEDTDGELYRFALNETDMIIQAIKEAKDNYFSAKNK